MLVKDPDERSSADYIHDEVGQIVERMEEMERMTSPVPVYDDGRGPRTPRLVTVSEASTVVLDDSVRPPREGVGVWDETAVAYYLHGTVNARRYDDDEVPPTPVLVSLSEPSAVGSKSKPDLGSSSILPLERRSIADQPYSTREPETRSSETEEIPRNLSWESIVSGQLGGPGSVGTFDREVSETHEELAPVCKRGTRSNSLSQPPPSAIGMGAAARTYPLSYGRYPKRNKTQPAASDVSGRDC